MTVKKKHILSSLLIFFGLLIALCPVFLSNNYIRQDDLMWEIWPHMKMSDFGYLYYNTIYQLVRPLCMLSFYLTDLISIDIQYAVYVRFMNVVLLGCLGVLLYFWQLNFNQNRILAITFAISTFTLPAYQIFAATANYSLILTALLLTFGALFSWHHGFSSFDEKIQKRFYWLGSLLFFASLLEYPLSSMFVWSALVICYLNTVPTTRHKTNNSYDIQFCWIVSFLTIGIMVGYYLLSRTFHILLRVNLSNGRATQIDFHNLSGKFGQVIDMLGWHANFWQWDNVPSFSQSPIFILLGIFASALTLIHLQNNQRLIVIGKRILSIFALMFVFFFLAYSPVLASPDYQITFRYALATMPILLYILFWSIQQISNYFLPQYRSLNAFAKISSASILCGTTLFGMYFANLMLADGIVGPHTHDFLFIQQQLQAKVIPLLKQNQQVVIHAIACDEDKAQYPDKIPTALEYGMRTCQFQQQVIGVIIHSLRKFGYASNNNAHNNVIYLDKEIIVKDTPWGTLVVNSTSNATDDLTTYTAPNQSVVTIDTRQMLPYQHLSFYKKILGLEKS